MNLLDNIFCTTAKQDMHMSCFICYTLYNAMKRSAHET